MALWMERKRLRERDEREAAGELLWTEQIVQPALHKVSSVWVELLGLTGTSVAECESWLLDVIIRDTGMVPRGISPSALTRASLEHVLTTLEALYRFWSIEEIQGTESDLAEYWERSINTVFNSHRVAFKMVDGEFIPYTDDAVYQATVEPTLRLLIDKRFDNAQRAFRDALREIQDGKPADAITDAGTALQETFKALGVQGKQLGDQFKDAKKKGLFTGRDQPMLDGIDGFLRWAASERNQNGDAHTVTGATLGDAWLAVHVVGALILRLAEGTPRV